VDFRAVSTQLRILGLIAILAVGFLILGPEDEPPGSDHQGQDPAESTTDRHLQPREPTLPILGYDYGIVGRRPDPYRAPRPYGERGTYPEPPYPYSDAYHGGYVAPDAQARTWTGGYRFRPLTERELERRQTTPYSDRYADPYATPYPPYPQAQSSAPLYPFPPPPGEGYNFRPPRKSPGARGRWQGPSYSRPDHYPAPSPMAPGIAPPYPQWGSTPPSQHLYPNRYRRSDCRLTVC